MTALVNISADNVHAIKEGLNDLGNALLSINAIAGDDTTSRLIIDGGGGFVENAPNAWLLAYWMDRWLSM